MLNILNFYSKKKNFIYPFKLKIFNVYLCLNQDFFFFFYQILWQKLFFSYGLIMFRYFTGKSDKMLCSVAMCYKINY